MAYFVVETGQPSARASTSTKGLTSTKLHIQQKTAVAIECRQRRSRDAGDPPGVLALLHCRLKGAGERTVAMERRTNKNHVTTRTLRQPSYA